MYRLLGPHINKCEGGIPEEVIRWRPPVCVVIDHSDSWRAVKEATPQTRMVGRLVSDRQPDFNQQMDPVAAARAHCDQVLPLARRFKSVYDYWQGTNETVIQGAEAMGRYARFEVERVRILGEAGFRAIVGNFAVGNPSNLAWWQEFLPALEAAKARDGILGLHQYWWANPGDVWTAYRHRLVYRGEKSHGWAGLPKSLWLPLILTECGLDIGVQRPGVLGGFRDALSPEVYAGELAAFSGELEKDPYLLGAAIYCFRFESAKWSGYDIWPEPAGAIISQARPLYRAWSAADAAHSSPQRPAIEDISTTLVHGQDEPDTRVSWSGAILHHSATEPGSDSKRTIQRFASFHVNTRGWPTIAYHFVVDSKGQIFQTLPLNVVGNHSGNWNVNRATVGVCMIGNFVSKTPPTEQISATVALLRWIGGTVRPHFMIISTACPGKRGWEVVHHALSQA